MGYSKYIHDVEQDLPKAVRERIDEQYLDDSGKRLDTARFTTDFKCDLIGGETIARHMGVTAPAMLKRLHPPNSYYHIEKINIAGNIFEPLYVLATASNSGTAGNDNYAQHVATCRDSSNLLIGALDPKPGPVV